VFLVETQMFLTETQMFLVETARFLVETKMFLTETFDPIQLPVLTRGSQRPISRLILVGSSDGHLVGSSADYSSLLAGKRTPVGWFRRLRSVGSSVGAGADLGSDAHQETQREV
jgi:hypothetical protein